MFEYAILTILAFLLLILKISPNLRQKILGYDLVTDVFVTIGFILLFGGTGTFGGMMVSIIAGLFFSLALYVAKSFGTYQRLVRVSRFKWKWQASHGKSRQALIKFVNNITGNNKPAIEGIGVEIN